jgi:nucleoside-diphosphate-sugar epimerase
MHENDDFILVTGCTSLIGARLVAELANDYSVVGFDLEEPEHPVAGTTFIQCDLGDKDSLVDALEELRQTCGTRIASVVHLADSGTTRLLDRLQQFAVEQLVFPSSILSMRPAADDEVITEESALIDAAAETLLAEKRGRIPVAVLRIGSVYDEEGRSPAIAHQIRRIYERKLESYVFPGNKQHQHPFVHVDDVVDAIVKTVDRRSTLSPWEVFLIAEDEPLPYARIQDRIGDLLEGHGWPTVRIPTFAAKLAAWITDRKPWMVDRVDAHYPVLIDKARLALGWTPQHRLWDVLPAIVAGLYHDPRAWYRVNELGDAPAEGLRRYPTSRS